MKTLLFITSLLSFNFLYSQDIENTMMQDTVYVLFKADKNQNKYFENALSTWNGYYFLEDFFLRKDKRGISIYDSDFNQTYRKANVRYEKKCFLLKHKNQIIGIDFFKKLLTEMEKYGDFKSGQVYYIIDEADFKRNKIKLIEVDSFVFIIRD